MQVGPAGDDGQLHVPGDDGCERCAVYAHLGSAEVAENQHVDKAPVYQHRSHAAHHGHHGLTGFPEGAGIGVGQSEGQEAPEHHGQIAQAVMQRPGSRGGIALTSQVQTDEEITAHLEYQTAQQGQCQTDEYFEAEGVAHAFFIPGAVELGGENTGTGAGPEDAQVEHEQ